MESVANMEPPAEISPQQDPRQRESLIALNKPYEGPFAIVNMDSRPWYSGGEELSCWSFGWAADDFGV